MTKLGLARICFGLLYTYLGLVLFLTGVNIGFSSLGAVLGEELATGWTRIIMIPLSMLLGWFIISTEPAVAVLENQIEEVSAGAIPGKAIKLSLSIAIAIAMGISMLRVLTGIPILWFLIPGYAIALILSFFVPDIYTAIAFDSGGVASGPMTATFMLQFVIGASMALGGNVLQDAFGVVAMVAMMPLISIQTVGFIYKLKEEKVPCQPESCYGDYDIVELWEEDMDVNYVISICGPESLNTLTSICRDLKLPLSVILLGEGTASRGMLDILGIESNEKMSSHHSCKRKKDEEVHRETEATDVDQTYPGSRCGHSCSHKEYRRRDKP